MQHCEQCLLSLLKWRLKPRGRRHLGLCKYRIVYGSGPAEPCTREQAPSQLAIKERLCWQLVQISIHEERHAHIMNEYHHETLDCITNHDGTDYLV
jgi:hypothetical protein